MRATLRRRAACVYSTNRWSGYASHEAFQAPGVESLQPRSKANPCPVCSTTPKSDAHAPLRHRPRLATQQRIAYAALSVQPRIFS